MGLEYKFRGKACDGGRWVYGDIHFNVPRTQCHIHENGERVSSTNVIAESVGLWTGLKDVNGVEVYEGDIFKVVYSDTPDGFKVLGKERKIVEVNGVVVYKWSGFYIEHKEPIDGETRYGGLAKFLENPKEVVGNTTDNPELKGE